MDERRGPPTGWDDPDVRPLIGSYAERVLPLPLHSSQSSDGPDCYDTLHVSSLLLPGSESFLDAPSTLHYATPGSGYVALCGPLYVNAAHSFDDTADGPSLAGRQWGVHFC